EADQGGFWDVVWLNDHLYPPKADESRAIMDAWSLFGGLAAVTERIRFGAMVTANTFRHPAVLAKQAVTIDRMSQGRLELGVGTGWHEREHEAFGIDLPPLRRRFELLEETFAILHGLMTEEVFDFVGKHRTITSARFEPKPIQRPRPPFVVGGIGPRRTIPLAARWADQWNFPDYTSDLDLFRSCLARLDEACEEIERDRSEIEVSVQFRYPDDVSETVDRVAAYREAGADHALVSFAPPTSADLPPAVAAALAGG
ncbi:MAG TPA: LLM class flavin-dependent oxidoreductase, partial [Acidimicrobiia bacterium]